MSATNIRALLSQLTGQEVRVFLDDSRITGRVAAITDDLLVLCASDDVVWVEIDRIKAVRIVHDHCHHDEDEDDD